MRFSTFRAKPIQPVNDVQGLPYKYLTNLLKLASLTCHLCTCPATTACKIGDGMIFVAAWNHGICMESPVHGIGC